MLFASCATADPATLSRRSTGALARAW